MRLTPSLMAPDGPSPMASLSDRRRFLRKGGSNVIMTSASNPEVMAICYAQGWAASADEMTAEEAAVVTSLGGAFKNSAIVHFDEFAYFVNVTLSGYDFQQCTSLTSIALPSTATTIEKGAFYFCVNLVTCAMPNTITIISYNAFLGCSNLVLTAFPTALTSIGNTSFVSCKGLTAIELPQTLTAIGTQAFQGCVNLATITCLATTAPSVSENTFTNTGSSASTKVLQVPSGASGYDSGYWQSVLQDTNGFTLQYI